VFRRIELTKMRLFITRTILRKPYIFAALLLANAGLLLAAAFLAAYLTTGSTNARHPGRREHQASGHAYVAAIEADARRAIGSLKVTDSPMDWGLPVIANPAAHIGIPISTDSGPRQGPGRFELVFTCVGHGRVEATLSIGRVARHLMAACRPFVVTHHVRLDAHRTGLLIVQFAARGRETVAVAYKLGGSNTS